MVEETPNPLSLKFVLQDYRVYPLGAEPNKTFFIKGDVCLTSSFARDILSVEGIQGVFLGKTFITITKLPTASWEKLKPQLIDKIERIIVEKKEFFTIIAPDLSKGLDQDFGVTKQIKDIIKTRVRPFVEQDGGDIEFHSFQNGIVFVKLLGSCSGCPSSFVTLKNGVEKLLQYYVPEVKLVEAIKDGF